MFYGREILLLLLLWYKWCWCVCLWLSPPLHATLAATAEAEDEERGPRNCCTAAVAAGTFWQPRSNEVIGRRVVQQFFAVRMLQDELLLRRLSIDGIVEVHGRDHVPDRETERERKNDEREREREREREMEGEKESGKREIDGSR